MHTQSQTLTLGASGGSAAREAQKTYRERLSCVTLGRGLDSYHCLSAHFWCNPQTHAILPVWTPPCTTNSESALACEISLPHPVSPWDPAPPNPQITCSRPIARQPASPGPSLGPCIHGQAAALSLCNLHISEETFGSGPLVPAQATVPLGQIEKLCGPEADSSWHHCNL